ncbi:MAG: Gfo/Idh/MocA family oxidoreductase, partial [Chloroflexi bacterium]|nr:Gfo/Idh/MocA family oxidoreductase [Chloroflexota bacterium]
GNTNAETAKQWGIASDRVYQTWPQMLEEEKGRLDAIVVLTPTPEHLAPVMTALDAGYPVICEKALASTSPEAARIHNAVEATSGFLSVTYNYTGYPMVRELREMIRRGHLGRVEQIHIEMPQEGFARLNREGKPMVPQQWRMQGGAIPTISLDLGVHLHHMIDFLTGEKPLALVATQSSLGRFRQVVDNTMALVQYTNGLECSVWFSKAALGHRNGLRVRVYGEEGSAEWFQMEPEVIHFSDNCGHQFRIDRASNDVLIAHQPRYNRFKSGHPAGFLEAFANLYADIAEDLTQWSNDKTLASDYTFTSRHALEGLVMLEAIERSARERRWVDVDMGGVNE